MTYYFLKDYNNYFNRTVKLYSTLDDYLTNVDDYVILEDVSYNPGDHVTGFVNGIQWTKEWHPDYLLVIGSGNKIVDRWFITDFIFTSFETYNAQLRSDLLAKHYNSIITSPCFVEKGFVPDTSSLIYNSEDFMCDQIPTDEGVPIVDQTRCSWLTIYYDPKFKGNLKSSVLGRIQIGTTAEAETISVPITQWTPYVNYGGSNRYYYVGPNNVTKQFCARILWREQGANINPYRESECIFDPSLGYFPSWQLLRTLSSLNGNNPPLSESFYYGTSLSWGYTKQKVESAMNDWFSPIASSVNNILRNDFKGDEVNQSLTDLLNLDGKLIRDSNNDYWRVSVINRGQNSNYRKPITQLTNYIKSAIEASSDERIYEAGDNEYNAYTARVEGSWQAKCTADIYEVTVTRATAAAEEYDFDFSRAQTVADRPYGIIAIPYKPVDNVQLRDENSSIAIALAKLLVTGSYEASLTNVTTTAGTTATEEVGRGFVYDVQILPYCPMGSVWQTDIHKIYVSPYVYKGPDNAGPTDLYDFTYITNASDPTSRCATVLFPTSADYETTVSITPQSLTGNSLKIENQCTNYRLCSPSFDVKAEYNLAKNGGMLNTFTIRQTLMPTAPLVQVQPVFRFLYGANYRDDRGIVCTNNFSYMQVSDAWEQFKMQNKTYQAAFNREVQKLDVDYDINMEALKKQRNLTGAAGVLGMGGSIMSGNMLGAAASAGGMFIGLGNKQIAMDKATASYNEQRSYMIDMHNYQLQNVKALPRTITNIDAFTLLNRLWPTLQKFTCPPATIQCFKNKLEMEGMTINYSGTIETFINPDVSKLTFIKGQLYRLKNFTGCTHEANEIANEVAQGFYTNILS